MAKYLQMLGMCLLPVVAACGGGGVQSTPAPTPAPTPTPTAPASFPLTGSATFQVTPATRIYSQPDGDGISTSFNPISFDRQGVEERSSRVSVAYDAAANAYILTDDVTSAVFKPSDLASSSNFVDTYFTTSGGKSDRLTLYGNAKLGGTQAVGPIALSYVTYGAWTHVEAPGNQIRNTVMVLGFPTPTSDMPKSGSADYATSVSGSKLAFGSLAASTLTEISGTATFTADFANSSVSTVLSLPSAETFAGTAPITENQFFGPLLSDTYGFVGGAFSGGFFGPAAQEMGYAYHVFIRNPDPYAGASPSQEFTYLSGAVVGTKK